MNEFFFVLIAYLGQAIFGKLRRRRHNHTPGHAGRRQRYRTSSYPFTRLISMFLVPHTTRGTIRGEKRLSMAYTQAMCVSVLLRQGSVV